MGQPLSLQERDGNEGPELDGREGGHYLEPVARQQHVLLALAQEAAERTFYSLVCTLMYVYTDFP